MSLYSTDNMWDVPTLDVNRQPSAIATPIYPWGALSRATLMSGCWVFYVDDYRFSALIRDPLQLLRTGCKQAVEPNVTTFELSPRFEVIHATGVKRRIARTWQDAGVEVFVDLNIPGHHRELAMLGVPKGWRAFATRGYALRLDALRQEHALAAEWAGRDPLMLVYGGGPRVEAVCRDLPGAIYVPDHMQLRRSAP